MPSLRFAVAQAASTTVVNLIAGSKFEFLPVPSMVEIYAVSDQVDTTLELTLGNVIEFDQMTIPQFTPITSGGPNMQDHRVGGGVGAAGDRVVLKVVTVTACAAGGLRVLVVITPV